MIKRTIFSIAVVTWCMTVGAQSPGSLDTSFDPGEGANERIHAMALQPDGKILIGGHFAVYDGVPISGIARIMPDGSLDPTFNPGAGAVGQAISSPNITSSWVNAIAVQADGRILIAGNFTTLDGAATGRIARLNTDGSIDPTFSVGTGANAAVYSLALDAEGKILMGGSVTSINGTSSSRIARLNPDGSLDMGFMVGTGFDSEVFAIAVLPDGKIMVGGSFTSYNGAEVNKLVKLANNGGLDLSFDPPALESELGVRCMALQPDGKIIIGGSLLEGNSQQWVCVMRVEADGTTDPGFAWTGESVMSQSVRTMALQADGRIVIGGNFFSAFETRFARLMSNGAMDQLFNANTGTSVTGEQFRLPYSLLVQPDGRILLSGNFISFAGIPRNRIARIHGQDATSVQAWDAQQPLRLWPNPANERLYLSQRAAGRIFDVQGALVSSFPQSDVIEISGLPPGVYTISLDLGGVVRFVVH